MDNVDLINRDPNAINTHLQCNFEDVIAEPDGTHSLDCVWKISYFCFGCWKSCCYKLATLLCGICIASCWGCEFASITFNHVWCLTPSLKQCGINCTYWQRYWTICISCCMDPVCTSCGQIFHAFKKN